MTRHNSSDSKTWLGLVLVALGGYFLLRNFDLIPAFLPYWVFTWKSIFVIVGGAMLITGRREGFVFFGIGVLFLLPDLFDIPRIRVRDWWPAILIVLGLSIFLRRRGHSSSELGSASDDFIDATSIFGGSEKTINSQQLKGGRITSIFGGSELNMRDVKLGQKEVVIDYLCIFGGNELIVPNDWTVVNDTFVLFGGYSDKRLKDSGLQSDPEKILRIKGLILFGGSEVRGV